MYEEALAIAREIGDRQAQANTLNQIGNVYLSLNQHDRAAAFYQRALAVRQEEGRSPHNSPKGHPHH